MKRDAATQAQVAAANPKASTWLAANAGSGKTRVLTDRVARLLLDGVPPQRILCLTYTKAAASEMQNRLFQRLGDWAMMPDAKLRESLTALGAEDIAPDVLSEARRLFAKAIETPGGLKIQTIHSFCASLLRRFPLEAGVSPAFTEMDDRAAKALREDVMEEVALQDPDAMAAFAQHFSGAEVDGFLQELLGRKELFDSAATDADLRAAGGLGSGVTEAVVLESVFHGNEAAMLRDVAAVLQSCTGKSDMQLGQSLAMLDCSTPSLALLTQLEKLFLSASGKSEGLPKLHPPTKGAKEAFGALLDPFDALRMRVSEARPIRQALAAHARNLALHKFAQAYLPRLDSLKQSHAWLDFDDLILKARGLLTDPSVAAWVLFRLDGGIDHILVDEAQDTAPRQWDVVRLLAQEFTAGQGARADTERTIFVVGDQKQSIYSFQGADPDAFEAMRAHFDEALTAIGQPLQRQDLLHSFRSSRAVLGLVDASFTGDLMRGMGGRVEHVAFKQDLPGRVDQWDWIDETEKAEKKDWFDPVDTVGDDHHSVLLARQIAATIKDRLLHGQITEVKRVDGRDVQETRRIMAGDFLILVQRRSTLFHEIIRACKDAGLPMAGADRLRIGAELGVKDLTALMRYLATPEDDLSLAAVLRSPLCGLSEGELFDLAHGRPNYLTRALEEQKDRFAHVSEMLRDLRNSADYLRPYDLLERVLTRHNGREKLLARLGIEADEGIAALLDQAMAYERADIPSLTGFLEWLARDEVTIKRQMDSAGDAIRVMTVHGAKGLEAPIVILPDTGQVRNSVRDDVLNRDGVALWKAKSDDMPPAQVELSDEIKKRQREERMRLLYVAMTRAESWLIICGAGKPAKLEDGGWYAVAEAGMAKAGVVDGRLAHLNWPDDLPRREAEAKPERAALPAWVETKAPTVAPTPEPLSPSKFEGAKALPDPSGAALSEEDAKARGTALHRLFEHLPHAADPMDLANRLGRYGPNEEDLYPLAQAVLGDPSLAHIFADGTLAEVTLTAKLPSLGGQVVLGTIDRLIIEDDRILAVDFKSNVVLPDTAEKTPTGILSQMGAYLEMLEQLYPQKSVEVAILWTQSAQLMTLPHDIVRCALVAAHTS
ncbi:DNA helicase/exodeoxyribonuclease V, subunit A [Litoreibacter ascidiaceicola]|uniref:DNA 3'-5' helicase n=1 Tax=Litoreibacter ascidiaceicola TaxID=1486859 RepID=A0A1M5AYR4_9RHOB|nr:double-strand break repair helicase AddA [Litoreibacter ascidiaceicola]SHF35375.1 DNA helicase/exodeoxyribonuclease V, subunit A [Litoreibacter ascidiaceicola]